MGETAFGDVHVFWTSGSHQKRIFVHVLKIILIFKVISSVFFVPLFNLKSTAVVYSSTAVFLFCLFFPPTATNRMILSIALEEFWQVEEKWHNFAVMSSGVFQLVLRDGKFRVWKIKICTKGRGYLGKTYHLHYFALCHSVTYFFFFFCSSKINKEQYVGLRLGFCSL